MVLSLRRAFCNTDVAEGFVMKKCSFVCAAAAGCIAAVACSSQPDVGTAKDPTSPSTNSGADATLNPSSNPEDGSTNPEAALADTPSVDGPTTDDATADATTDDGATNEDASVSDAGASDAHPDVQFIFDAGTKPDAAADASCASTTVSAQSVPLDMYVMLDKSASMTEPALFTFLGDCNIGSTTNSKWCYAINALSQYFTSSNASGNAAALQVFPLSAGACTGTGYDTAVYPTTGYQSLPSSSFDSRLNTETPDGNDTPTEGALRGIVSFTSKSTNRRSGRVLIGVLVTDGVPTACVTTAATLKGILQTHYNATATQVYVIGMTGADFPTLETIAEGGNAPVHNDVVGTLKDACGTKANTCRHWNVGNGNGGALSEAMKQIQKSAVACTYSMPTTDAGIVDPTTIHVEYVPNGTSTPQILTRQTSASGCGTSGGYYYDNNSSPTTIQLCPASCTTVQADSKAKVNISLGCQGS